MTSAAIDRDFKGWRGATRRLIDDFQGASVISAAIRASILRSMGYDIAKNVSIRQHVRFHYKQVRIDTGSAVAQGCFLDGSDRLSIQENVWIGPRTMILTGSHEIGPSHFRAGAPLRAPVTIGRGAWIGANCTILPGVTIGKGAVITAGSLVHKDVPANVMFGGNPARLIKRLPLEGEPPPHLTLAAE